MKTILAIFFVLFTVVCTGQKRLDVPGTRASMKVPEGALSSPYYGAFTKLGVFEISFVEFQGNLYDKFQEIDSISYVKRGAFVYDQFEMQVDGFKGKVIHGYSNSETDFLQCIFGDTTFNVLVSTLLKKNDKPVYDEILSSYRTIRINKKKEIDWSSYLSFTYDTNSIFKLHQDFANSLLLILKKGPGPEANGSYITISQFPNLGSFQNIAHAVGGMLGKSIFTNYEIESFIFEGETVLNEKKVYDFSAYCKNKAGDRHLIRCVARMNDEVITLITATIMTVEEEKDMKAFFDSVQFKF